MASPPPFDKAVSLINHCDASKSPYVQSHADNATAWQLWSPTTLQLARETNRLLLVSIGYSACHWCHVMAHESFADTRIAQLLNEHFIPVKIDREERPDIDRQYMDFLQATTGAGGWPLNVFVTPDLKPIFGGTYFARAAFEQILVKVAAAWKDQEQKCRASAEQITAQLKQFAQEGMLGTRPDDTDMDRGSGVELDVIDEALFHYKKRYDSRYHGFGGAPKFPTPVHLRFLLQLGWFAPEVREIIGPDDCVEARQIAVKTLTAMAKGGIKDQIGHGFARYSVTRDWSLPHFEKMLYDNAQLLPAYLDAYLLTKSPLFYEMVEDVATYLTSKPMLSSTGGIHSSEDADSLPTALDKQKREGAYYVWTFDELKGILNEEELNLCTKYYNVHPEGNIERRFDVQGELTGQNTLCIQYPLSELATELKTEEKDARRILETAKQKLLAYREKNRPRPALDDKIVTSWNGLSIAGLARAAAAVRSHSASQAKHYATAAEKAFDFIRQNLFSPDTETLRRVYREGPGETPGFAEDYAFLISGLIDLYEAEFNDEWLQWADKLQQTQNHLFWDDAHYGFFSTPADQPDILVRSKDAMDNAEPSVNGVSAFNLFRLGALLEDASYVTMGQRTVAAFEVEIGQHPGLFTGLMASVAAARTGMYCLMLFGDGPLVEYAQHKAHTSVRPLTTVMRLNAAGVNDSWLRSKHGLTGMPPGEMVQICGRAQCLPLDSREHIDRVFAEDSKPFFAS